MSKAHLPPPKPERKRRKRKRHEKTNLSIWNWFSSKPHVVTISCQLVDLFSILMCCSKLNWFCGRRILKWFIVLSDFINWILRKMMINSQSQGYYDLDSNMVIGDNSSSEVDVLNTTPFSVRDILNIVDQNNEDNPYQTMNGNDQFAQKFYGNNVAQFGNYSNYQYKRWEKKNLWVRSWFVTKVKFAVYVCLQMIRWDSMITPSTTIIFCFKTLPLTTIISKTQRQLLQLITITIRFLATIISRQLHLQSLTRRFVNQIYRKAENFLYQWRLNHRKYRIQIQLASINCNL